MLLAGRSPGPHTLYSPTQGTIHLRFSILPVTRCEHTMRAIPYEHVAHTIPGTAMSYSLSWMGTGTGTGCDTGLAILTKH